MNPESYQRHISLLLEDLDVLSRKYCYEFPVLRGFLKGYFKGLLFLHLSGLRKYASFKKEAISFRKYGCIWYEASKLNELFKTCIIKYLPFLAYAYFKRLNDR